MQNRLKGNSLLKKCRGLFSKGEKKDFQRSWVFVLSFVLAFGLSVSALIGYVFPNAPFGDLKENKNILVNVSKGSLNVRYPFVKVNFTFTEFRGSIVYFDEEFLFLGYCKLSDGSKNTYSIPVIIEYKKKHQREKKKFTIRLHDTYFEWKDFSDNNIEFKLYPKKNKAYIEIKDEKKGQDKFRIHWGEAFIKDTKIELLTK